MFYLMRTRGRVQVVWEGSCTYVALGICCQYLFYFCAIHHVINFHIGPEHMKEFATNQEVVDIFREVSLKRSSLPGILKLGIMTTNQPEYITLKLKVWTLFQQLQSFIYTPRMWSYIGVISCRNWSQKFWILVLVRSICQNQLKCNTAKVGRKISTEKKTSLVGIHQVYHSRHQITKLRVYMYQAKLTPYSTYYTDGSPKLNVRENREILRAFFAHCPESYTVEGYENSSCTLTGYLVW